MGAGRFDGPLQPPDCPACSTRAILDRAASEGHARRLMNDKRQVNRKTGPRSSKGAIPSLPSKKLTQNTAPFARGAIIAGRYKIVSKIGSGGMGVVYAAIEMETGREVALKGLHARAFTTENLRRFRREAQTAASVKNRHLCAVYYLGVEAGTPFIVMERLAGETLRRRLTEAGPVSASDAVTIMIQLLDGLEAAHVAGILHRDIKPANIFIITPRGESPVIRVIDFGLAKLIPTAVWKPRPEAPTEELSAITTTDVIPGTPFYRAPEQVSGTRDLDGRVDVWAAGLTFFEMLAGRRAYDAPSFVTLVPKILLLPLPLLSSLRDDLPASFDPILAKAIAKNRDERYPTAGAFRSALIAEWARVRVAGVVRGEQLRNYRPEPPAPLRAEEVSREEMTDVNVEVAFEPDE